MHYQVYTHIDDESVITKFSLIFSKYSDFTKEFEGWGPVDIHETNNIYWAAISMGHEARLDEINDIILKSKAMKRALGL